MTPDGFVVHSVTGPVKAAQLLEESSFAVGLYEEIKKTSVMARGQLVSIAHQQAGLVSQSRQDRMVHELLTSRPLPHLQSVYKEIFEDILGQRVSEAGPRLVEAERRIAYAKKTNSPILFVLHDRNGWNHSGYAQQHFTALSQELLRQYVVVTMPLREGPALSQVTKQPPFEGNAKGQTLFVITQSDCKQTATVSGWSEQALNSALAHGWASALELDPPTTGNLVKAQRLLRKADPAAAERVKALTIKVHEEAKRKRAERHDIVMN